MAVLIALLRAVNVAGRNRVGMVDLRAMLDDLGFTDVRSLLQSGNLVFSAQRPNTTARIESLLEHAARKRLGVDAEFLVRTAAELRAVIAANPFPQEAETDPAHLVVTFLKEAPSPGKAAALQKAVTCRERVHVKGRHAYIVYPDGIGRSRLTAALIEGKLGVRGTSRNWNTVLKLGSIAER